MKKPRLTRIYNIKWEKNIIDKLLTTKNSRIFKSKNGNPWKKLSSGGLKCFNEQNKTDFKIGYIPSYQSSLYCSSYQPAPMICSYHRKKKEFKKARIW